MDDLRLRTLGRIGIVSGREYLLLGTKKQLALVAYLACQPGWNARKESVIDLLWPQVSHDKGRRSLNQAVYDLRRRLPSLRIISTPFDITVTRGSLKADVRALRRAIDRCDVEAAVRLMKGPFLYGFDINGAPGFSHWRDNVAGELEARTRAVALDALSEALSQGQADEALSLAGFLLALNSLDREAIQGRIAALGLAGHNEIAVEEATLFEERWIAEFGQTAQSESLLARLLRDSCQGTGGDDSKTAPPFVGRKTEFETLTHAWEGAVRDGCCAVVIGGKAGIGKTRLAHHFLRLTAIRGAHVLQAKCYEAQSKVPYAAMASVFREDCLLRYVSDVDMPWRKVLLTHFPTAEACWPRKVRRATLDPDTLQHQLQESVCRLFEAASVQKPLVFFIDDYQWADQATKALIDYLVRKLKVNPVLLLLAARDWCCEGQSVGVFTMPSVKSLRLAELRESETNELVSRMADATGGRITPDIAESICARSGGLPFYAVELARDHLRAPDRMVEVDRATQTTDSIEAHVKSRLASISDQAVRCINTLAAVGGRCDVGLVRDVSDLGEWAFAEAMTELVRLDVVRTTRNEVELLHGIFGEVVEQQMAPFTRRVVHGKIAAILSRRGAAPARLARHLELSGNPDATQETALAAADEAQRANAYQEAEYFLRMALAACDDEAAGASIMKRMVRLHMRDRRYDQARALLESLSDYFNASNDTGNIAWVGIHKTTASLGLGLETTDKGIEDLRHLAKDAMDRNDLAAASQALKSMAIWVHNSLALQSASDLGHELIELAKRLPNGLEALETHELGILLIASSDSVSCAHRLCGDLIQRIDPNAGALLSAVGLRCRAQVLLQMGKLSEAEVLYDRLANTANRLVLGPSWGSVNNNFAVLRMEQGRYGDAVRLLEELRLFALDKEVLDDLSFAYYNLGLVYLEKHEFPQAQHAAHQLLDVMARLSTPERLYEPWSILGLIALEKGNLTDANRWRREILLAEAEEPLWFGDTSYRERFLARMGQMDAQAAEAIGRLRVGVEAYVDRDFFCRSRMELELARLLARTEPAEAKSLASSVRQRGAELGARPLVAAADAVLDRIRFRGQSGA